MAFDSVIPYAAAADLSAKQYHAVKDNGSGAAAAIAADTDVPIGILQNKPAAAGKSCTINFEGVSKVVLGGTVAKGDHLGPDASGAMVKRTLGTDTTKYVCARAGAAGVSGDVIPAVLIPVPFRAA
jgi:hypothetical protein